MMLLRQRRRGTKVVNIGRSEFMTCSKDIARLGCLNVVLGRT